VNDAVYRVSTSVYKRGGTYYLARGIRCLARLSKGAFDILHEEVGALGEYDAITGIQNLDEIEDGLYTLQPYGCFRDWETGIEECDGFMLVPYKGG